MVAVGDTTVLPLAPTTPTPGLMERLVAPEDTHESVAFPPLRMLAGFAVKLVIVGRYMTVITTEALLATYPDALALKATVYDPTVGNWWLAVNPVAVPPSPKVQPKEVPKSVVPTKFTAVPGAIVMAPEG